LGKVGLGLRVMLAIGAFGWSAAAAPRWRLVYFRDAAAVGCPDEDELRRAVAARLGRDPFDTHASGSVVATITKTGSVLAGTVEVTNEAGVSRGRRELSASAATCEEMASAIAISISIAVDPEHALAGEPSEMAEETAKPAAPTPVEPTVEPTPARDVAPRRAGSLARARALSIAATSVWGVAPTLAWGGSVRFQKRFGWLALGGGALAVTSPSGPVGEVANLATTLAAGELEACAVQGIVEACAVGLWGATWARASDVARPRTDAGMFLAAGGRLGLFVPLSPSVGFFADASVLGVTSPVRATIDGAQVWQAPPLAVALAVGTKFHFL
jgi:hypothetical protein